MTPPPPPPDDIVLGHYTCILQQLNNYSVNSVRLESVCSLSYLWHFTLIEYWKLCWITWPKINSEAKSKAKQTKKSFHLGQTQLYAPMNILFFNFENWQMKIVTISLTVQWKTSYYKISTLRTDKLKLSQCQWQRDEKKWCEIHGAIFTLCPWFKRYPCAWAFLRMLCMQTDARFLPSFLCHLNSIMAWPIISQGLGTRGQV